jgi:hypothetical protein
VPGTTYYLGPGSYEVDAAGLDIWNAQDSFRFVYTTRTNNFDIEVQVPYVAPADQWTKAGLMVREAIDPADGGSRMMSVEATASTTLSPLPIDGSGAQNAYSMGVRSGPDTAAYSPAAATGGYFVGDGIVPVPYPNVWIRLTRTGYGTTNDEFTGYYSTNGSSWTSFCDWFPEDSTNNSDATPFPSVVYVGMCTVAHEGAGANQADMATVIYQNFGDYVAKVVTGQPVLTATLASPTTVSVSWKPGGGTLYSSPVLTTNSASWSVVGTSNPAVVPISGSATYFEIRE